MNKNAIEQFCLVLESDRFEQYNGSLRGEDNKRCCLGVACDVYKEITGKGEWDGCKDNFFFAVEGDGGGGVLPISVAQFYGFRDRNPEIKIGDREAPAGYWNDVQKKSFKEIAEAFRKTYLHED